MTPTALQRFPARPLPPWRRAVLKVGSSLLAGGTCGVTATHSATLAGFVRASRAQGRDVVLVSSGAVAAGRALLASRGEAGDSLAGKQALAALGQTRVMALWQGLFDVPVAQVLLTHDDFKHRRRFLNARGTLRELLRVGAIPVVNENDTVSVRELRLGDNDNLAAMVATLVDADLLLIASDVPGLYDADPRVNPAARPLPDVAAVTPAILRMAGGSGTEHGTGGMRTKLQAARKAGEAGIATALFPGGDAEAVHALAEGRLHGTLFASHPRIAARKHWIRHAPPGSGMVVVDAGAAAALRKGGASLLPGGVIAVEGEFGRGDVIDVRDAAGRVVARGVAQYPASEVRRIRGRHSREIDAVLGYRFGESVVHRDDLVLMEEEEATT